MYNQYVELVNLLAPHLEVLCSLCKVLGKITNHCVKVSAPCKRVKGKGEMEEGQRGEGKRTEC